jgi:hypothetical protein
MGCLNGMQHAHGCKLIARPLLAMAAERKAFSGAVAVWHFKGLEDTAGANSVLKPQGPVETGRTFCDPKALGVDLFAEGGPGRLESLDVWEMQSMWDD